MARSPDPGIRAEKPAGLSRAHRIEAEMHAIHPVFSRYLGPRPESEHHIRTTIHNDARAGGTRRVAARSSAPRRARDALSKLEKGSALEVLLADLHPVDA